jgi:hypothetical protein
MKENLMLPLLVLFMILSGQSSTPAASPYVPSDDSVGFDVKLVSGTADLIQPTVWLATHKSKGHVAVFRVELNGPTKPAGGPIPMSFGKGRFLAEPGSDSTALIQALKKALQAKTLPAKPRRVAELPFEFAVLGRGDHRRPDGSFDSSKKGDWVTLKLFFGNDAGEVFLNLNPVSGKGEFSIKDSDYGDYVVGRLAQVL